MQKLYNLIISNPTSTSFRVVKRADFSRQIHAHLIFVTWSTCSSWMDMATFINYSTPSLSLMLRACEPVDWISATLSHHWHVRMQKKRERNCLDDLRRRRFCPCLGDWRGFAWKVLRTEKNNSFYAEFVLWYKCFSNTLITI